MLNTYLGASQFEDLHPYAIKCSFFVTPHQSKDGESLALLQQGACGDESNVLSF